MAGTENKRLLVLTSSFPRRADDTDPRFIEELCYELAEGFDDTVLAPHCRGARRRETLTRGSATLEVHRFRYAIPAFETLAYGGGIAANLRRNPLRVLLVPLFLIGQLVAARRLCRTQRFAALHAHWVIPQGVVAMLLRRFSGGTPPWVVTAHGSDLATLRGPVMTWLKRRVLRAADAVTVVSAALRDEALALGCDARKLHVASMGVDLENTFTPGPAAERRGLIYVGKLDANKGVTHLLEALAALATGYPDLALSVVGDGSERARLEARARELGIASRIRFKGALPQEALPAELRHASIAVIPSLREGLGLVAVEALGCGTTVVASDLPAIRGVVRDGRTGMLARPGDSQSFAARISTLLDDADLRERLAKEGHADVLARFDWKVVGVTYRRIIGHLVSDPQ